jgi:hypothetical protein
MANSAQDHGADTRTVSFGQLGCIRVKRLRRTGDEEIQDWIVRRRPQSAASAAGALT